MVKPKKKFKKGQEKNWIKNIFLRAWLFTQLLLFFVFYLFNLYSVLFFSTLMSTSFEMAEREIRIPEFSFIFLWNKRNNVFNKKSKRMKNFDARNYHLIQDIEEDSAVNFREVKGSSKGNKDKTFIALPLIPTKRYCP